MNFQKERNHLPEEYFRPSQSPQDNKQNRIRVFLFFFFYEIIYVNNYGFFVLKYKIEQKYFNHTIIIIQSSIPFYCRSIFIGSSTINGEQFWGKLFDGQ